MRPPLAASIACSEPAPNEKPQLLGRIAGFAYLGNFVTVVSVGILSRLGLINLPPINLLTDIANNAMDQEIAAGNLNPLLATGWATGFWLDLLRQYNAFAGEDFVPSYCAAHASLCAGISF